MTITTISDTHSLHRRIKNIPMADVLIHAGDVSTYGEEHQILDFLNWFSNQPHQYKIFIAGNHDFFFERENEKYIQKHIPTNVIYLNDSGCEINGTHFYGSPITPEFMDWAFNKKRGAEINKHWKKIPSNTDILITHGPPFGKLDTNANQYKTGCDDLLKTVEKIKPKYHIFGHIHEAYGMLETNATTFINASILDEHYKIKNSPIVFEI
ncbi:MAG: metallophosphatase domain-containing protein [Bacteroidetes bacterium]|nr:metallophosphatase domain-containing protein [Bacteroidota bacterium]